MKYFLALCCVGVLAGCAHKPKAEEPSQGTITATGGAEINRATDPDQPGQASEPLEIHPQCKKVVSCYNALARDLCLKSTEDCSASFTVTTPVDKPETCKRLLEQAGETAKPFMADPKYKMPNECG